MPTRMKAARKTVYGFGFLRWEQKLSWFLMTSIVDGRVTVLWLVLRISSALHVWLAVGVLEVEMGWGDGGVEGCWSEMVYGRCCVDVDIIQFWPRSYQSRGIHFVEPTVR